MQERWLAAQDAQAELRDDLRRPRHDIGAASLYFVCPLACSFLFFPLLFFLSSCDRQDDGENVGAERALVESVHGVRAMLSLVDAEGASLVDRSSAAGELERLGTKLVKQQQKAAQLGARLADPVYCARAPAAAQEGERARLDEMRRSVAGAEQSMHDLEAALAS